MSNLVILDISSNLLTGSLPQSIYSIAPLQVFSFANNFLTGTIGSEIGFLSNLTELILYRNSFSGVIPSEIGLLFNVTNLSMDLNRLTGTLPPSIFMLSNLQGLYLNDCVLTGTFSSYLSAAKSLSYFWVYDNFFTGTIPSVAWTGATSMNNLAWQFNYFSGTIATEIASSINLEYLALNNNFISSQLPSELGSLPKLLFLYIDANILSGTIPGELGLQNLQYLYLFDNLLTGTIPSELFQSVHLETVIIYDNYIEGTLPTSFGNGSSCNLQFLFIYNNLLTGSIPPEISQASSLHFLLLGQNKLTGNLGQLLTQGGSFYYIDLANNRLTGSIPNVFNQLQHLEFFVVYGNYLTGSIPATLGAVPHLFQLMLQENYLTGPLPSTLSNVTSLSQLVLSFNSLTGTIPSSYKSLQVLELLNISNNQLFGQLTELFSPLQHAIDLIDERNFSVPHSSSTVSMSSSSNSYSDSFVNRGNGSNIITKRGNHSFLTNISFNRLEYLDLSVNSFSGPVPDSLFERSYLRAISLYSNCFSGTLPSSVCTPPVLQVLMLDGLGHGALCETRIPSDLSFIVKAHFTDKLMQGTIPSCLWGLPELTTLHLSGNGLHGTIGEVSPASKLDNIAASYNYLVGTIPVSLQLLGVSLLDLSSNRLSGTLVDNFVFYAVSQNTTGKRDQAQSNSLSLHVNRISGFTPTSLRNTESIQILEGNVFECDASHPLPAFDPVNAVYICGSSNFLDVVIIWLSCIFVVIIVFGIVGNRCHRRVSSFNGNSSVPMLNQITPNPMRVANVSGDFPMIELQPSSSFGQNNSNFEEQFRSTSTLNDNNGSVVTAFINWCKRSHESAVLLYLNFDNIFVNSIGDDVKRIELWKGRIEHVTKFLFALKQGCITITYIVTFYIFLVMMSYLLLKYVEVGVEINTALITSYSTHYFQYMWTATAAFTHGALPVALLLVYLVLSEQMIRIFFSRVTNVDIISNEATDFERSTVNTNSNKNEILCEDGGGGDDHTATEGSSDQSVGLTVEKKVEPLGASATHSTRSTTHSHESSSDYILSQVRYWLSDKGCYHLLLPIFFQLINCSATLIANIIYVLSVIYGFNEAVLVSIQLFLGFYKVVWNAVYVPYVIARMQFLSPSSLMAHTVAMKIFNYITGPIIATYLTDSNCLYYALKGPPVESSSFTELQRDLPKCRTFNVGDRVTTVCEVLPQLIELSTTLSPPWLYSYQCSSALLVNYVPVLIFTFTITGILQPLFTYIASILLRREGTLPQLICWCFSGSIYLPLTTLRNNVNNDTGAAVSHPRTQHQHQRQPLFNSLGIISRIIVNFAVVITFGLASPLLALAVAMDVLNIALLWRYLLVEYTREILCLDNVAVEGSASTTISMATDCENSNASNYNDSPPSSIENNKSVNNLLAAICDNLESTVKNCCAGISHSIRIIVVAASLFWSLFVFDMVADVYGDAPGGYGVMVTLVMTLSIFELSEVLDKHWSSIVVTLKSLGFVGP